LTDLDEIQYWDEFNFDPHQSSKTFILHGLQT